MKCTRPETQMLFEEILNSGADLRVRVTGRSMAPFLKGGEILTIRKVPETSLRVGNLIFSRESSGQAMIHRIVRKWRSVDSYWVQTKGDALMSCDPPIRQNGILGKVVMIVREYPAGGRSEIDLESPFWVSVNAVLGRAHRFRAMRGSAFRRKIASVFRSVVPLFSGRHDDGGC